jgi:hypothetical protein
MEMVARGEKTESEAARRCAAWWDLLRNLPEDHRGNQHAAWEY